MNRRREARNPRRTFRSPYPSAGSTYDRSLRARSPFTRPCRSFCCAFAELIRDQTPPDDFCNYYYDVRATKPVGSRFPRRDGGLDHLPFLAHHAAHRWAVARGEPRYVRSCKPRCWFFPVTRVCPAAMPIEAPHHRGLPRRCIVRINEHGSKDRAKDASRSACDGVPCLRPVPTLSERRPTAFPSSATFGHPLSPARSIPAEEAADTDHEPTKAFVPIGAPRRAPPSGRPGCLQPPRHARHARDLSLPPSRRLSRSRRPHFFPRLGRVLWLGIASVTVRSPAIRDGSTRRWFESTDAFTTPREHAWN